MRTYRLVSVGWFFSVMSVVTLAVSALMWGFLVLVVMDALAVDKASEAPFMSLVIWTVVMVQAARLLDRFALGKDWLALARNVIRAEIFSRACLVVVSDRIERREMPRALDLIRTLNASQSRTERCIHSYQRFGVAA